VSVLTTPGKHVGGLLGTRESAHEAGYALEPAAEWLRTEDFAWDATTLLQASLMQAVTSAPVPGDPSGSDGRLVAIVQTPGLVLTWDPPTNVAACDPPATAGTTTESVCALVAPTALWHRGDGQAFAARAELPVWLSALAQRHEPDAVATIPDLLALARGLARRGFEPTVLEGVTELDDGVRVVGRAGEDAVVAVGIAPRSPWVFPYSDGAPWDLVDGPRVVALAPGSAVKLRAANRVPSPVDLRRTIVFRHAVH